MIALDRPDDSFADRTEKICFWQTFSSVFPKLVPDSYMSDFLHLLRPSVALKEIWSVFVFELIEIFLMKFSTLCFSVILFQVRFKNAVKTAFWHWLKMCEDTKIHFISLFGIIVNATEDRALKKLILSCLTLRETTSGPSSRIPHSFERVKKGYARSSLPLKNHISYIEKIMISTSSTSPLGYIVDNEWINWWGMWWTIP